MPKNAYQFKITLKGSKPPIWRRVQVPEDYSLYDLHIAIQDSFPWGDYHLHEFSTVALKGAEQKFYGFPDFDNGDWREVVRDWTVKIGDVFQIGGNKALNYTYDFGNDWEHRVELEKILLTGKGIKYPCCLDGRRTCPPEDCGGYPGYEDMLKILQDPRHEEYKDMCNWLAIDAGSEYDPEYFDPREVEFRDPKKELKMARKGRGVE